MPRPTRKSKLHRTLAKNKSPKFDIAVIGGGWYGREAALALKRRA